MAGSNNPTIVVIDPQKLRQTGLVRLLEDWADLNTFDITAISSCEDLKFEPKLSVVVVNVGGVSVLERPPRIWLQSVRSFVPRTPLVILSDREDRGEICAAFAEGARGFIPTSFDPALALDALMFIHRGGSFFPSSALLEEKRRIHDDRRDSIAKQPEAARTEDVTVFERPRESNHTYRQSIKFKTVAWSRPQHAGSEVLAGAAIGDSLRHPEVGHGPDAHAVRRDVGRELQLTPRQREVLKGLGEGKPNKVIARDLDMTESTVKVHVRQIMRKFGVENRTQVAVFAIQFFARGNLEVA